MLIIYINKLKRLKTENDFYFFCKMIFNFNNLNLFGFLFESMCIRDLRVYTQAINGEITFYRDENNFEIDAILRTQSGKWGAIEIKLGAGYNVASHFFNGINWYYLFI